MTLLLTALLTTSSASLEPIDVEAVARATMEAAPNTWTAIPFLPAQGLSIAEFSRRFLGVSPQPEGEGAPDSPAIASPVAPPALPDEYDWRTANSTLVDCIGPVVNQSPVDEKGTQHKCGSCWAVSAVETFADRRCIAGRQAALELPRVELSALDLIACDRKCQDFHRQCNMGCQGGFPELAWQYFESNGVRSAECMPYNLSKQLLCPLKACEPPRSDAPYYSRKHYKVAGASHIRAELVARGPVQTTFTVYEDFLNYAGGVYHHVTGRKLGLHAVKVIGYGVDERAGQFWTAMNSWGPQFGLNGTFMIAAGECGFEQSVLAGLPCLPGDPYLPCHKL